jgi:hypothetical protein
MQHMARHLVGVLLLVVPVVLAGDAAAQVRAVGFQTEETVEAPEGLLHGTVVDEAGDPLAQVLVSAMGMTTVFAVTNDEGRFVFRGLPFGAYLVRAHLKGYSPATAREVEVTATGRALTNFELTPHAADDAEAPEVLAAGLAPQAGDAGPREAKPTAEDAERAWRLRHLRRSILKDEGPTAIVAGGQPAGEQWMDVGRMMAAPARLAAALFSDPAVNAEINILTSTSFSRPQDLFSGDAGLPRGVTYVALQVPDADAVWSVQGAMTQGDLASWILAGSYASTTEGPHGFEVGMSYAMQRYAGGNTDALASMGDGSRNSGAVYAFDRWALGSRAEFEYGARFAAYDYVASSRGLWSPHASIAVTPFAGDTLRVRATVLHDHVAPGASEFLPPSSGLLLPPERTFSSLDPSADFVPEQVNHVEVSVEREVPGAVLVGVRAFRQDVSDQIVTLFGLDGPGDRPVVGHYYVGSMGDVDARGVGVRVSRALAVGLTGTVDYTVTDAVWTASGSPAVALALVRPGEERVHDLTTSIEGEVPVTATRVFFVYTLNTGLATLDSETGARTGRRFDLRVNQGLPFLDFTSAQWEMLVAVRNLFHDGGTRASVLDEVFVVSPPKQIVGGLTVRF